MLRDGSFESTESEHTEWVASGGRPRWRVVDAALRDLAGRRSALDADEARWLREAERLKIWRELGYVSMLDYLERVTGYAPRTASDRLRVARMLGTLPKLEAALAGGRRFSAVRELTRVATPATEAVWLASTEGKSLREIEEMVAGLQPGDLPGDLPDPARKPQWIRFEVLPATKVRVREARAALDQEAGRRLTDDEFVRATCGAVLDGAGAATARAKTGRAKYQIAMTVCGGCEQGWVHGGGVKVAVDRAMVEQAHCDAQHLGSLTGEPARATQTVPPRIVRFVWHRDGGRCRVPGCRSARNLELHHLRHREAGGGHDPGNIMLCCDSCHAAHHRGAIEIRGRAPDRIEVVRPHEPRPIERASRELPRTIAGATNRDTVDPCDSALVASAPPEVTVATSDGITAGASRTVSVTSRPAAEHLPHGIVRKVSVTSRSAAEPDALPAPASRRQLGRGVDAGAPTAPPPGGLASSFAVTAMRVQARDALVALGWKPVIARGAVEEASAHVGTGVALEFLIAEALRRCLKRAG
jgi:5-methylcytosine-specific restriction endonuclease McrA